MPKSRRVRLSFLTVVALILFAVFGYVLFTKRQENINIQTALYIPDWKTYENEEAIVRFQYPKEWKVLEYRYSQQPDYGDLSLRGKLSEIIVAHPKAPPEDPSGLGLLISFHSDDRKSADELVDERLSGKEFASKDQYEVLSTERMKLGGKRATRIKSKYSTQEGTDFVVHNVDPAVTLGYVTQQINPSESFTQEEFQQFLNTIEQILLTFQFTK